MRESCACWLRRRQAKFVPWQFFSTLPVVRGQRQGDGEADTRRTIFGQSEVATLRSRNVAGDCQPQARSTGLSGEKRLKKAAADRLWNRRTCVLHLDQHR